jgi:hypothetical protein
MQGLGRILMTTGGLLFVLGLALSFLLNRLAKT